MDNPRLSIIIPVYNHAEELGSCLESIFAQTYQNYEIIVVNDGSTDNFTKAIEPYRNRVKVVEQQNQGANQARNRGFSESKGELLLFCDADIVMDPDMLDAMVQSLDNHPEVSFVYSSFRYGWKKFKLWSFDPEKLKQLNYIHTTSMIRRKDFPGFDNNIKRLQDWDLWLTMIERGKRGWWIDEILFRIKPRNKYNMSEWVPSFMYKIPWFKPRVVKKFELAKQVIKEKHNLT
jgi:glycosyltransferase involved in cell wall biosynthesis